MLNVGPLLVYAQILGAVVGAGASVWGEWSYFRAMRDGSIDKAERAQLRAIGYGLTYGMTTLLLASGALVYATFFLKKGIPPALSTGYWLGMGLSLVIVTISSRIARRMIHFGVGNATLFAAWWLLTFLSLGWLHLGFGAALFSLLIATIIFYALFSYARLLAAR